METYKCNCGQPGTFRCMGCLKKEVLCLKCIGGHLEKNPLDSIIPFRVEKKNESRGTTCELCNENPAKHLQVFDSHTVPLCKNCKKELPLNHASVFVPVKWKDIVACSKDINEIYIRSHSVARAMDEADKAYSANPRENAVNKVRNMIIKHANTVADGILNGNSGNNGNNNEVLRNIKKDIEQQSLKKDIDANVLGGKLLMSIIQCGVPCDLPIENCSHVSEEEVKQAVENLYKKSEKKTTKSGYNVYLFTPGKQNLTKIDVEKMTRKEFIFDRNWTFEASWCELENGNIFFCGGNGQNNSEVLIVDVINRSVAPRKNFIGRSGHSILEKRGNVYVFGGNKGNIAEKYSLMTGDWEQLTDLPIRISRISICEIHNGIFMTGIDCQSVFVYNMATNTYSDAGSHLEPYRNKNKMVFCHEDTIYCMCGDKLFYCNSQRINVWSEIEIPDKDWWSYSKPVIYRNCAFFIKYFVRNLWQLDLKTFALSERIICDIPNSS